ncbi:glycosyltransferase family 4 protein [Wenyingzhuangia marina]|uniref:Glycosyltransferase involved in cell wall bisynthesis n=1 Tax=Wenyingzhuangia marina TaxID=1195760 RepID=A0A1M5WCW0_9FLAO|nr:glycosyltransferase family 4 protein [Wenyingzhuangia marina]GGF81810.1 glycosyl transferase family 1 [Wenyingzhuangia marina]SHH85355.1 Glycosyltransferase involved in cell wall bisynthesis [Wenyingzhuangia marina]
MNKIVFVSPNINKDGAEKSLIALQVYLNSKGISTLVVIPKNGLIEELLIKDNVDYIVHHFVGSVNFGRGKKLFRGIVKKYINIFSSFQLAYKLKKKGISVVAVHSNTITTDFGHYLASRLNTHHFWHIREFGKLDFNFDFELGMDYMAKITKKAAKIICNSNAVKNYYSKYFETSKLVTVYNGVKPSVDVDIQKESGLFKMLLIGRLSKEKGQKEAILACSRLLKSGRDNFLLNLYGTGKDLEYLKDLIKSLHLEEKIILKGYSDKIEINKYDVGLMCSPFEAFGRVTVEYMFAGLPVIGKNAGGTPEIINKDTGILYSDEDSLYKAMSLLYDNQDLRKEMGYKANERAIEVFSENKYCENILKVYKEIIEL